MLACLGWCLVQDMLKQHTVKLTTVLQFFDVCNNLFSPLYGMSVLLWLLPCPGCHAAVPSGAHGT